MRFYHDTHAASLDSIRRDGLLPRDPADHDPCLDYQPAGIYLWRHYADAVGNQRRNDDKAVITVDIPERSVIDDWEFDVCDCCDKSCAVHCPVVIPASRFITVHRSTDPEFRAQLAANRNKLAADIRRRRTRMTFARSESQTAANDDLKNLGL